MTNYIMHLNQSFSIVYLKSWLHAQGKLTNEVDQHVPLSSIIGWIGKQELDQTSIYWLLPLCRFHTSTEKVVAALDL